MVLFRLCGVSLAPSVGRFAVEGASPSQFLVHAREVAEVFERGVAAAHTSVEQIAERGELCFVHRFQYWTHVALTASHSLLLPRVTVAGWRTVRSRALTRT